jgi:hypothetical protein
MEHITTTRKSDVTNVQSISRNIFSGSFPDTIVETNPILEKLGNEGSEHFYNYIEWLGLAKNSHLTILSSSHHYFYDSEELKEVETLVNQKQLNQINQINDFLHNIYHILPTNTYFIGCFFDNKNQKRSFLDLFKAKNHIEGQSDQIEDGIASRIPLLNMMYNIIDSRTNRYMTKRTVTLMLEDVGLKVLDMTKLNELTYFCTQKYQLSVK